MLTSEQAKIIDRLRKAASLHGEVGDLLTVLADCLCIPTDGNEPTIVGDPEDFHYLRAAVAAQAFVELDRQEG